MKKKKGRFLIRTGMLLIAAAVALCGYNVYDGHRAGTAAQAPINHIEAQILTAVQSLYGYNGSSPEMLNVSEEQPYPGMQPSVVMEVPAGTVNPDSPMETVAVNFSAGTAAADAVVRTDSVESAAATARPGSPDVLPMQTNPQMQTPSDTNIPAIDTVNGYADQTQKPLIPGMKVPDSYDRLEQDRIVTDTRKETVIPDYVLNPKMEMPVSRYDGQDYIGILEIPAINLKIPVISQWSYPGLKIAPCRYTGSAYTNDMVISAHNYTSHFGNLKRLSAGAAVRFTDIDGNVFNYRVGLKETLDPHDIEYMTDSGWDLTLFTCTVGGSYRVTVRCNLVKT